MWQSETELLRRLLLGQERIMATLTDISNALTTLSTNIQTGFTTLTTDLTTLLSDLGAEPAQIQAIVDSVNAISTTTQSDVANLDAAIKAADPGAGSAPATKA